LSIRGGEAEEQDTLAMFGAPYAALMKTTKMFVPFVP
jgi:protein-S-isoprenylcysteine O-methyltransferase Ste14